MCVFLCVFFFLIRCNDFFSYLHPYSVTFLEIKHDEFLYLCVFVCVCVLRGTASCAPTSIGQIFQMTFLFI